MLLVAEGCSPQDLVQVQPAGVQVQSVWVFLQIIQKCSLHELKHQIPAAAALPHFQKVHQVVMTQLLWWGERNKSFRFWDEAWHKAGLHPEWTVVMGGRSFLKLLGFLYIWAKNTLNAAKMVLLWGLLTQIHHHIVFALPKESLLAPFLESSAISLMSALSFSVLFQD